MPISQLLDYLSAIQPSSSINSSDIEALLVRAWECFDDSGAEGMESRKLIGRIEDATWNPPVLSFNIERHGATVLGSTRADVHTWKLNLETREATCFHAGRRQLYPTASRLDVNPLAEEIAQLIFESKEDDRLVWKSPHRVRVQVGKVIPGESVKKQTLAGRRKRFRTKLVELVSNAGWQELGPNNFELPL
jgi:hypothetical protein